MAVNFDIVACRHKLINVWKTLYLVLKTFDILISASIFSAIVWGALQLWKLLRNLFIVIIPMKAMHRLNALVL